MKFVSCILLSFIAIATAYSQCPKFEVIEPQHPIQPGSMMEFSVRPLGKTDEPFRYTWTIDRGIIISGQRTAKIVLSTAGFQNTTVTASVKVSGPGSCRGSYKGSGIVSQKLEPHPNDEFGVLPIGDLLARLDPAIADANALDRNILVVSYGPKQAILNRARVMTYYTTAVRGLAEDRIAFVNGKNEKVIRSRIWVVSKDASDFSRFAIGDESLNFESRRRNVDLDSIEAKKFLRKNVCPLMGTEDLQKVRVAELCLFDGASFSASNKTATGSCPAAIEVVAPSVPTAAGEIQYFTVHVSGVVKDGLTYTWSSEEFPIIEGQDTRTIGVRGPACCDRAVVVSVTVGGLPGECTKTTAAASGLICNCVDPILTDEFGSPPEAELIKRLRVYITQLSHSPTATGYIVNYGSNRIEIQKRTNLIRKLAREKDKNLESRLRFIGGGLEPKIRTRLWVVPLGARGDEVN